MTLRSRGPFPRYFSDRPSTQVLVFLDFFVISVIYWAAARKARQMDLAPGARSRREQDLLARPAITLRLARDNKPVADPEADVILTHRSELGSLPGRQLVAGCF